MNELTVFNFNHVDVVDSREVAQLVERPHNDLMKSIRIYADYISTAGDFSLSDFFIQSTYKDSTGRTLPCYLLTKKGCDMVANKMTGEKGVLFTAAYVTAFEKMREKLTAVLPKDYPAALQALLIAERKMEGLRTENLTLRSKALFAESVAASKSSILVGELAKLLTQNGVDIGQNRLFEWLRDNGYLIRRQGSDYNMPTQRSMEKGLFEIKETSVIHSDGHISINKTPKVTGKGQRHFLESFLSGGASWR